jgi:6,7-dimethyl-8-ribityllumazine synthase
MKPILLVVAPYYTNISQPLIAGASAVVRDAGYALEIVEVPGALEIPAAINMAAASGRYEGFVALGCVLRGETYHFEIVCNESSRGLQEVAFRTKAAIGNGILTCETEEQALTRADVAQGNKGGEAARATLALIALRKKFGVG